MSPVRPSRRDGNGAGKLVQLGRKKTPGLVEYSDCEEEAWKYRGWTEFRSETEKADVRFHEKGKRKTTTNKRYPPLGRNASVW